MRRLLSLTVLALVPVPGRALDPKEVVVLVNKTVPASREVADHYVAKRNVPRENIFELDLPAGEGVLVGATAGPEEGDRSG